MPDVIKDGTGKGFQARVNTDNELEVKSVQESEALFANKIGDAFNINTGFVVLSNAVDTPVLYLKNTDEKELIIEAVALGMFNSANGSATADVYATFIRNPTTGTIITSTPTDVDIMSNRNYTSSKTFPGTAYKGATGDTMTDGDDHILVRSSTNSRGFIGINEVLPQGSSFGVKIKPPTSNTAMTVYVAVICYLHDKER